MSGAPLNAGDRSNSSMPHWDDPRIRPSDEPQRIARYRRLQSWYRDVQLKAEPGTYPRGKDGAQVGAKLELGSMLRNEDVAVQEDLNFIDPAAFEHAHRRIVEVPGENGTLDPMRLKHNLLSSMPLCFNLFGTLRAPDRRASFLALFQEMFDPAAVAIDDVVCEWAPTEAQGNLKDRTAFDAVVFYRRADGPAFLGVETKYTEPFSRTTCKPASVSRYAEVTDTCGWFHDPAGAATRLNTPTASQLWRNVLLAGALTTGGSKGRGGVAVVALEGDNGAASAIDAITSELDPAAHDRLRSVTLERIIQAAPPELRGWADRFQRRYLDVGQPDDPQAGHDPDGPSFGRTLTRA